MIALTLGSLFDGSGGFPLAGVLCGITPLWASEIEPYPIAVTRSRFPNMDHLGSVTKINGGDIPPVDIITFGSPCQDMSVAGKRAGMKHEEHGADDTTRSGLFYEAVRIIREMREATNGLRPAFAIWENVLGAFTSNGGEDFRCVLEELQKACGGYSIPRPADGKWLKCGEVLGDGWSIAWRVFDAQYWGVPQRRRRIYLVTDFGGGRAGKILFEREGLQGCTQPGRTEGEGAAADTQGSAGGSGADRVSMYQNTGRGWWNESDIAETLRTPGGGLNQIPSVVYPSVARTLTAESDASPCVDRGQNVIAIDCRNACGNEELSATLQAKANGGQSLNCINPIMYQAYSGDVAATLDASYYKGTGSRNGKEREILAELRGCDDVRIMPVDTTQITSPYNQSNPRYGDPCGTLNAKGHYPAIIVKLPKRKYIVRRLTPKECQRLQGFPDGYGAPDAKESITDEEAAFWTGVREAYAEATGIRIARCKDRTALVKWYNRLRTDSAEYKMWGNGIALPCALYVMQGIVSCELRQGKD